ncbi:hypothetical protein A4H02_07115 [Fervidobacterium thailandense]|uniref:Pyrrolo-quinoline quinone repeat domain-containing protein n=1 Tax=Fervidobacterium thailandense TaxID=1008305 RepID=A0A1E3G1D4_9BACT|nr:hypothetical protein A4H02_07115 [Fervidobacterium thailandense]
MFSIDFQFFGHRDVIWRIRSDGRYLFTSSADGSLKVWDGNLRLIQSIPTHESWARALAVNDKYVAVGGYKPDNMIKVFDKVTFKLLKILKVHSGSVFTLEFYKDLLISGGSDNWVVVTDLRTWKSRVLKFHDAWVREVLVMNDTLVSVDDFGKVVLTDLKSFRKIGEFKIDALVVSATSDGAALCFFGDSRGKVWMLSLTTGSLIRKTLERGVELPVESLEYSGGELYCGMGNFVYRLKVSERELTIAGKFSASPIEVTALKLLGKKLFVGNKYGELYTYTPDGRYLAKSQRYGQSQTKIATFGRLMAVGRETGEVEMYDNSNGKLIWRLTLRSPVRSIAFDGQEVVVGCANGLLAFISSGKITKTFKFNDAIISVLKTSKNVFVGTYGQLYLLDITGSSPTVRSVSLDGWVTALHVFQSHMFAGTNTGEIYVLDFSIASPKVLRRLQLDGGVVRFFENAGKKLFVLTFTGKIYVLEGSRFQLFSSIGPPVYSLSGTKEELLITGDGVYSISPQSPSSVQKIFESEAPIVDSARSDGRLFLALSNGRILEVEYTPGSLPRVVKGYVPELSPITTIHVIDKETIACGHENGELSVWRKVGTVAEFVLEKVLADHAASVRDIVVYGELLISASSDRTIKVWNRKTGRLLNTITWHGAYVWALDISGNVLVSGDWEGRIFTWKILNVSGDLSQTDAFNVSGSISDLKYWKDGIVFTTLEGEVGILKAGRVQKRRIAKQTLWTVSTDAEYVFAAGWDGIVFVLDGNLNLIAQLKAHNSTIFKLERFGNILLTAGSDNLIKIWEISKSGGKIALRLWKVYSDFRQSILAVAFSKETEEIILSQGREMVTFRIDANEKGGTK